MNPIKFLFFLLSLAFVSWFWLKISIALTNTYQNLFTSLLNIIVTVFNMATILYLTYQIPYSIYWLMMNWGWEP